MSSGAALAERHMRRACQLALSGEGAVEPNPMVGCVIARGEEVLAEGWHRQYGGPHAEVDALSRVPDRKTLTQATMYVTLEPCCHQGKTPPCTEAILESGVPRVVVACADPFPQVASQGIQRLRDAGVEVEVGVAEPAARSLLAPYLKCQQTGRPWVIAKWAMTMDGKIASHCGHSQWISNPTSRQLVHRLRGRVDGILVGSGTALADDPQLTARPPGPRVATRIVLDSMAQLPAESQLAQTATHVPTLLAVGPAASGTRTDALAELGVEILPCAGGSHADRILELLQVCGERGMTNVLVEGGQRLLGTLFDLQEVDEVHAFVAPKLIGGQEAPSPIGGKGLDSMASALSLTEGEWRVCDGDLYFHGRVQR